MTTILERWRSPGARAVSDAGPPDRFVFVGAIVSTGLIGIGWLAGPLRAVPWPVWMVIPAVILAAIGALDRDGWNIRRAMAYTAIRQRRRWTAGSIPMTPSAAKAWIDDPSNVAATGLERTSVLVIAGDIVAARAALDGFVPATAVDVAGSVRMRSYLQALETGTVDMGPIRDATRELGEDERRYQLTAAAFSQVWLDVAARRPWRRRFADVVRELAPYPVPRRVLAVIGAQQFAASIAVILATAIMSGIVRW
jgi:hypothetical protein